MPRLDPSASHAPVRARAGVCGRDAADPAPRASRRPHASTRGVGSARGLGREGHPCRWLRGGVAADDHTPGDLRAGHGPAPDAPFTRVPPPRRAAWRGRAGGDRRAARAVCRRRAAAVETVGADVKAHRGAARFPRRGTGDALCRAPRSAIAHDLPHFGAGMVA